MPETPRSTLSNQGGIPEARKKDVRLRERFQLPDSESCIENFSCAYSNKILRQGHIYVMLRHVCFHSSVYPTSLTIPTTDIESVLPKNNLFFPNSIEIVQTNGTKHFFTSFLSRERCLDLIKSRWQTEVARAAETEAIPSLAPGGHQASLNSPPPPPDGTSPRTLEKMQVSGGSVSLRRKGWPTSSEPSQDPNTFTEEGWTNILDVTLQGWDVTDVLTIFENNDTFITDWHNSLGDTDVSASEWLLEDGDRKREVRFTARIHDPPMGSGKFAKCELAQKARMHCDGSWTMDSSQHMPNLTIASFRVESYWRLVQLQGRTQCTVHLRVRFLKFSMLKATITSQSTSQAISCFATLKQRLGLRFPNQGTAADSLAISNEACHAAADICFALRIAKDAARRMPRTPDNRRPKRADSFHNDVTHDRYDEGRNYVQHDGRIYGQHDERLFYEAKQYVQEHAGQHEKQFEVQNDVQYEYDRMTHPQHGEQGDPYYAEQYDERYYHEEPTYGQHVAHHEGRYHLSHDKQAEPHVYHEAQAYCGRVLHPFSHQDDYYEQPSSACEIQPHYHNDGQQAYYHELQPHHPQDVEEQAWCGEGDRCCQEEEGSHCNGLGESSPRYQEQGRHNNLAHFQQQAHHPHGEESHYGHVDPLPRHEGQASCHEVHPSYHDDAQHHYYDGQPSYYEVLPHYHNEDSQDPHRPVAALQALPVAFATWKPLTLSLNEVPTRRVGCRMYLVLRGFS